MWRLDEVGPDNSSGSLEFAVPACGHEDFFPLTANFTAPGTFCDIQILGVVSVDDGSPMKFSKQHQLKVKEGANGPEYVIGGEE